MFERYEIFQPSDGKVLFTCRGEWIARLLTWRRGLDYARPGEGWPSSDGRFDW